MAHGKSVRFYPSDDQSCCVKPESDVKRYPDKGEHPFLLGSKVDQVREKEKKIEERYDRKDLITYEHPSFPFSFSNSSLNPSLFFKAVPATSTPLDTSTR